MIQVFLMVQYQIFKLFDHRLKINLDFQTSLRSLVKGNLVFDDPDIGSRHLQTSHHEAMAIYPFRSDLSIQNQLPFTESVNGCRNSLRTC